MRMPEDHDNQDERELQAPPELAAALKRVSQERLFVPPTMDAAILRAAERHLARPERRWFSFPVMLRWLAASAAVGAVVIFAFYLANSILRSPREKTGQVASTTGPGAEKPVDILDALNLAKRLQTGPVREPRWDINGDGKVDERDVQAIAAQAVRLDKGGRS